MRICKDREWAVWDSRSLFSDASPVKRQRIDNSTGCIMPFFDPGEIDYKTIVLYFYTFICVIYLCIIDTNLLSLLGKGDSSMRLYEFDPANAGDILAGIEMINQS